MKFIWLLKSCVFSSFHNKISKGHPLLCITFKFSVYIDDLITRKIVEIQNKKVIPKLRHILTSSPSVVVRISLERVAYTIHRIMKTTQFIRRAGLGCIEKNGVKIKSSLCGASYNVYFYVAIYFIGFNTKLSLPKFNH